MLRFAESRRASSCLLWQRLRGVGPLDSVLDGSRFLLRRGKPFVIAGTNVVLQDEETVMAIAREVRRVGDTLGLECVFKCSWDKANRTQAGAYRGQGMRRGLEILTRVKEETGLPILTDVHESKQVSAVAQVADIIQIPSFLCRQTDLIGSAARSGRIVNIKRGQFASPRVMAEAVRKANVEGAKFVSVCERGLMYGMDDLVFDPRQLVHLRDVCGPQVPIVVDVTHACQSPPSHHRASSSGSRSMVPVVARSAAAAGVDGIFVECHPDPDNAPVDSAIQLRLSDLAPLLRDVIAIAAIEPSC